MADCLFRPSSLVKTHTAPRPRTRLYSEPPTPTVAAVVVVAPLCCLTSTGAKSRCHRMPTKTSTDR